MMALWQGEQRTVPQPNHLYPPNLIAGPISPRFCQPSLDIQINAPNSPTFVGTTTGNIFNFSPTYNIVMPNSGAAVQYGETAGTEINYAQLPHGGTDDHINTNHVPTADLGKKIQFKPFGSQGKSFRFVDEVVPMSQDELLVLDRGQEELITFLAIDSLWSDTISQELQLKDLHHPSHMAILNNGNIVILDGFCVKTFKRGYQTCLGQFPPTEGIPTCLAVDTNNLIAVGYQSRGRLSLYKPEGRLVKTVSTPKIGEHLAIHNNRLIYISQDRTQLHAVDSNGKATIFSSDIHGDTTQNKAYGLCCDKEGSVFVAVHSGRLSVGEILYYDSDGEYMGCVRRVRGYPSGIAFTPDGDMVVAVENAVNIYPSCRALCRQLAMRKHKTR